MIEISEIAAMHLNILLNLETEWKLFDMANLSIGIPKLYAFYLSGIIFSKLPCLNLKKTIPKEAEMKNLTTH